MSLVFGGLGPLESDEWDDSSTLSEADDVATESAMSMMDYMGRDLEEDARVDGQLREMALSFGGAKSEQVKRVLMRPALRS